MRCGVAIGDTSGYYRAQSSVHSRTKFNCKRQTPGIPLRSDLTTGTRITVKGQDVLAWMEHTGRNRKRRSAVGVAASDPQLQKRMPFSILELSDVAVEAPRWDKVKIQKEGLPWTDRKRAAIFAGRVDASQRIRIEQNLRRVASGLFLDFRNRYKTLVTE